LFGCASPCALVVEAVGRALWDQSRPSSLWAGGGRRGFMRRPRAVHQARGSGSTSPQLWRATRVPSGGQWGQAKEFKNRPLNRSVCSRDTRLHAREVCSHLGDQVFLDLERVPLAVDGRVFIRRFGLGIRAPPTPSGANPRCVACVGCVTSRAASPNRPPQATCSTATRLDFGSCRLDVVRERLSRGDDDRWT
jgi:hypothetical protein